MLGLSREKCRAGPIFLQHIPNSRIFPLKARLLAKVPRESRSAGASVSPRELYTWKRIRRKLECKSVVMHHHRRKLGLCECICGQVAQILFLLCFHYSPDPRTLACPLPGFQPFPVSGPDRVNAIRIGRLIRTALSSYMYCVHFRRTCDYINPPASMNKPLLFDFHNLAIQLQERGENKESGLC